MQLSQLLTKKIIHIYKIFSPLDIWKISKKSNEKYIEIVDSSSLLPCSRSLSNPSSLAMTMTSMNILIVCTCRNVAAVSNQEGQLRHAYIHTMKLLVRFSHSWEANPFTLLLKVGSYSFSLYPKSFHYHEIYYELLYFAYSGRKMTHLIDRCVETTSFVPSRDWNGLSLEREPVTMAKVHSRTRHFNHWTLPSPLSPSPLPLSEILWKFWCNDE